MPQDFGSGDADADCADCPDKTENIIIVGSEQYYTAAGFWLKCMFLSCGYAVGMGRIPPPMYGPADRTTLIYVPYGYVRWELLNLDWLRDNAGVNIIRATSTSTITNHMSNREVDGDTYKIKNLVIFSHGTRGRIALNYDNGPGPDIDLRVSDFTSLPSDTFAPNGRMFSYACQTGRDMGQPIANHFGITVRAFYRRTHYGEVLRDPGDSSTIASALKTARKTQEGERIDLPPDHEAYPHPGLSGGRIPFFADGGEAEGVNDYSLWRLTGARQLPGAGATPEDQPTTFASFEGSDD